MGICITAPLRGYYTHAGSLLPQTLVGTLTLRCRETDKGWDLSTQLPLPPPCAVHPVLVHMDDDAHTLAIWMPAPLPHADACTAPSCRCLRRSIMQMPAPLHYADACAAPLCRCLHCSLTQMPAPLHHADACTAPSCRCLHRSLTQMPALLHHADACTAPSCRCPYHCYHGCLPFYSRRWR